MVSDEDDQRSEEEQKEDQSDVQIAEVESSQSQN